MIRSAATLAAPTPAGRADAAPDAVSAALEGAIVHFAETVRRVGWRHRLAEHEIDELMQEVRIRLWRARTSSDAIAAAPAAYVYRTATSAALDLIRRRRARREDANAPELLAMLAAPPASSSPEHAFEEHELQHCLRRALNELSDARRPVVRMYLAGHARDEIAALLGWTEPKTRNLLYRGLADLRQRLADEGVGS